MCSITITATALGASASQSVTVVDSNPDTITRNSGDFTANGFAVGDKISISGASDEGHDGVYELSGVAADTLTLVENLGGTSFGPDDASVAIATEEDTDVVFMVISGEGSSVAIGGATVIEEVENNPAAYKYPMSVLVNDSGGNPVPGITVTLSLWPTKYATGYTNPDDGPVLTGEFWRA
ncbi:MAG: hypothetical protein SWC96_07785 [Thermodesulfobacteriota bacterium]|nr:hypothetical protein [Thermodesulfobacteriota bacterium]